MFLKKSDATVMKEVLNLLETRLAITTAFVPSEIDSSILTHQVMYVEVGELQSVSKPQPLIHPLRMLTGEELGETVN